MNKHDLPPGSTSKTDQPAKGLPPRRSSIKASSGALATPQGRARAATMPSTNRTDNVDWRRPQEPIKPSTPTIKPFPSTMQISFPVQIAGLANATASSSSMTSFSTITEEKDSGGAKDDQARIVFPPPGIRGPAKLVLNVETLTAPQPEKTVEKALNKHKRVDSAASVTSINSKGHTTRLSMDSTTKTAPPPPVLGLDLEGLTLSEKNIKHPLYKTEMCRTWEETGHCRYGTKCQFAHGETELRNIQRHPKYKTEVCRTFWERGECPYGKRCCFVHHSKKEAGLSRFVEQLEEQKQTSSKTAATSENTTPNLPATPVSPAFNVSFEHASQDDAHDIWDILTPPMQPTSGQDGRSRAMSNALPPPTTKESRTRTLSDGFGMRGEDKGGVRRLPVFSKFSQGGA